MIMWIFEEPFFDTILRGSSSPDASEACNDPGNVSSCAAAPPGHCPTVYVSGRPRGCLAQHSRIDLGQKVID